MVRQLSVAHAQRLSCSFDRIFLSKDVKPGHILRHFSCLGSFSSVPGPDQTYAGLNNTVGHVGSMFSAPQVVQMRV